jgi:hypothetical protein
MMNKTVRCLLPVVLSLLLICAVTGCDSHSRQDIPENEDVLLTVPFALDASAIDMETSVQGTAFVLGDADNSGDRRIMVIATLNIDPRDWGGIEFDFPGDWDILSITSSYPEGDLSPEDYVSAVRVYDDPTPDVTEGICVGWNSLPAASASGGGGFGSLSFEIKPSSVVGDLPEYISMTIGLGSFMDTLNDVPIVHPCYIEIQIPLALEGQDVSIPPYTTSVGTQAPGPMPSVSAYNPAEAG